MLAAPILVTLALVSTHNIVHASDYYTGDGTTYTLGAPSNGNCNLMTSLSTASSHYAALNNEQWGSLENCGRCAEVSCADSRCSDTSKTEVVQILDRCPECKYGDLDLSPTIFASLTGSTPSRYKIKWRFVDCPVSGNIQYCLKDGSNPYWIAIQPNNVVSGVKSLSINGQSATQLGSAYYYLLDSGGASAADLSTVRTTIQSINGESITETVSLRVGQCTEGQHQFATGMGGGSSSTTTTAAPATTKTTTTAAPATTAAPPKVESTKAPTTTNHTTTEAGVSDASVASDADADADAASSSGTSSSTENKSLTMNNADGSDEANVLGTVAPASSTAASATTEAPTSSSSGVSEVSTRTDASTTSTSPVIIVLSCFGVVAAVVLIAMVVVSRRNQLAEEDKEDYIDEFMRQGSSLASAEGIVTIQHGVL